MTNLASQGAGVLLCYAGLARAFAPSGSDGVQASIILAMRERAPKLFKN